MRYDQIDPGIGGSQAGAEDKPTAIDEGRVLVRIPRGDGAERLQVAVKEYQGKPFVDVRLWWRTDDGRYLPGKKGLSIRVRELHEVVRALGDAERQLGQARGVTPAAGERKP